MSEQIPPPQTAPADVQDITAPPVVDIEMATDNLPNGTMDNGNQATELPLADESSKLVCLRQDAIYSLASSLPRTINIKFI